MSDAVGPEPERARLDAHVRGRVQGVGFRYFVLRHAAERGLEGWVRNEPDGSVRCRAEGSRRALSELLTALRDGPRGAWVDDVIVSWGVPSGDLGAFRVTSGSHSGD